jgi:hypothetical protein
MSTGIFSAARDDEAAERTTSRAHVQPEWNHMTARDLYVDSRKGRVYLAPVLAKPL